MTKINQLESLKVLKAVVECGSFTAAAKRLEVSAARVSKAIEQLEINLGAVLFKRSTRYMQVTDSGSRCYQRALVLIGQWQELQQELLDNQSNPLGKIRLNVPMTWGLSVFAPLLSEFMQLYPAIEFDTQLSDQHVNVLEGGYDLVLRLTHQLSDSSLLCQKLSAYQFIVCGTPQYLAEHGVPKEPTDLAQHDCLMYHLPGTAKKWSFLKTAKAVDSQITASSVTAASVTVNNIQDIYLEPKLVANNSLLIKNALFSGQGIAYMPEFLVADDIAEGKLQAVLTHFNTPVLNLYSLRAKDHILPYRVKLFIDFLRVKLQHGG